jgi:MFS family permease
MCVALALVIGANSSLSVALPDLAADLGATQTQLSYVVNIYALVFAALLLPIGIAADKFGRRGFLVAGLVVFGAASLASAYVDTAGAVIVLRGLAGLGAAAVMPATLSVLVDAFPPGRRTFAVSVWAGVSGAGAMLGVLLAGVMLELFWWGSVQVAYGVAAVAVALAALAVVPPSRNPALSLDAVGSVLALVGLFGLVLGIVEGPERGWTSPVTVTALVVGITALAAFVRWEASSHDPMLDVRLFRNPGLAAGSILVFLQFFAAFGFFYLAPQFLQFVQGHDALGAALRLLPLAHRDRTGEQPRTAAARALRRPLGRGVRDGPDGHRLRAVRPARRRPVLALRRDAGRLRLRLRAGHHPRHAAHHRRAPRRPAHAVGGRQRRDPRGRRRARRCRGRERAGGRLRRGAGDRRAARAGGAGR